MITDRNFTPSRLIQYPPTLPAGRAGVGGDAAGATPAVEVLALPAPAGQRSPATAVVLYSSTAAPARRTDVEIADPRIQYDQIPYSNSAGVRFYAATQQVSNRARLALCDEFA